MIGIKLVKPKTKGHLFEARCALLPALSNGGLDLKASGRGQEGRDVPIIYSRKTLQESRLRIEFPLTSPWMYW